MLYKYENNTLEKLGYYSYSDFEGKEKDLENLLAENLNKKFELIYLIVYNAYYSISCI